MAINNKLTKFKSATTIVTADYANSIFGGLYGSSEADALSPDDPRVVGHVHDGGNADGHAGKVDLVNHVDNQLLNKNLADNAVTKRNIRSSRFQDEAIPVSKEVDGETYYYLDLSGTNFVSGPPSNSDNAFVIWDGNNSLLTKNSNISYLSSDHTANYAGLEVSLTDYDLVLSPNGSGAIQGNITNGLASGGDQRGSGSVDLQLSRALAESVSSGDNAYLIGGASNKATGPFSGVSGGTANTASGSSAGVINGVGNSASGGGATLIGGALNIASGIASCAIGGSNEATGNYSFSMGRYASADKDGQLAHAYDNFTEIGDSQYTRHLAGAEIAGSGSGSYSLFSQLQLKDYTTYLFTVEVVARETSTGDSAIWHVRGGMKQDSGAASSAMLGAPNVLFRSTAGAAAWDISVSISPAGFLSIEGSSDLGTTVRWFSTVKTTRVSTDPP